MKHGSRDETICVDDTIMNDTDSIDSDGELRCLENAVNMETKSEDIRAEYLKAIILEIEDKVERLNEDTKFLRDDIVHKNNLITFLTSLHVVKGTERIANDLSDSSMYIENVVKENKKSASNAASPTTSFTSDVVTSIDWDENVSDTIDNEEKRSENLIDQLQRVRENKHRRSAMSVMI